MIKNVEAAWPNSCRKSTDPEPRYDTWTIYLTGETGPDWSSNSTGIAVAITGKSSFQG